uniref:3HCDH_N domain-containing protein n=1 Tax=Caenorhabditis tropicalis TaxID=1561998 RepID=A0A1I7TD74_9PELO
MMKNVPEEIKNYLMEAHQLAKQWHLPNNRGNYSNSESIPIKCVSVIGGGTMGRGIAISFCLAGFETILVELNEQAVSNCKRELEITYAREKTFKRLNDSKTEKLRNNLQITTDFHKLENCDLIVEAVFEDMKLKKELFTKLDKICKPSCIFGTNTSSLDLDEVIVESSTLHDRYIQMSSVLRNPTKVVGIHFFNPANLIRMVEVIYGSYTSSQAVATAFEACNAIKKLPVLVGNCPAFVFNRLLGVYLNQSQKLMYEYGYLPHKIDRIVTNFGFLMGPLTVADMNGLDDVINFLLYPMVNEGFLCIEEGIIDHENLIDIMFILGFGWPITTGGPMKLGRLQGIEKVANTLILWSSLEPNDRTYKIAETLKQANQKNLSSKL